MQQNQVGARMIYDNVKARGTTGLRTTQSFLRVEQPLAINKTLFQFPVLVNETQLGIFNTETRLNVNDSFVISSLAIFLAAPLSAVDAAFRLFTNAAAEVFTTALSAPAANVLYNSKFSIAVNNNKLLPSWDILRHQKIGTTQFTAAVNSPSNEFDGAEDAFYPVEPNITLIGNLNNVIQIEFPAGMTTLHPFSRIVIVFRGILIQAT
jgi:hypothetical protein